jgi:hypothetical protein
MQIETFTLRNGVVVLAKNTTRHITETADYFTADPLHFSGYARADRRAAELRANGINATAYESAHRRNLWYVAILSDDQKAVR